MTKLEELKSLLKEMQDLTTACVLLDWDLKTETPKYGVDAVVSSLTALSTKQFELSISPRMEELVYALNEEAEYSHLDEVWQKAVRITPANDTVGVLQDTHWAGGMFGYFPSYLLGSIYDGMFLETMQTELGDINTILAEGRAKEITAWLHEKIHRFGGYREPKEVLMAVCGKEADAKPLVKYFKEKYTKLYEL